MSEKSFFRTANQPEPQKRVRYFQLKDVLDRDGIRILSEYFDPESVQSMLETPLEQPDVRESYAGRMLDLLASGLSENNKEKIIAGLVGIGAGVSSVTATEDRCRESFFGCQVARDSTDKYVVALGSGTGGQRILLLPRPEGGYQRLLAFPSQGERLSGDYQRAFELLLGPRVVNISKPEHEPYLIAAINEEGGEDVCPCGSGKKYKQCHGAMA